MKKIENSSLSVVILILPDTGNTTRRACLTLT